MHIKKLTVKKAADSGVDFLDILGITSFFGFSLKEPADKVLLG